MNYWIFQAVPDRYDLREEPADGENITWYATRYRSRMEIGDLVFFWLGGPPDIRGIYGWGHLTGKPYIIPSWSDYGVDVRFEKRLRPHLSVGAIKNRRELLGMQILNMAVGSNFYISPDEARAISSLMPSSERPSEL
jgi:predicted RNA-binding protein with PUA-like domain